MVVLIAAAARRLSAAGVLHPPVAADRVVCLLVDIDLAAGERTIRHTVHRRQGVFHDDLTSVGCGIGYAGSLAKLAGHR